MEPIPVQRTSRRVMVASYGSYEEAQGAVDSLSDEGFAVDRLSIVAEGLRFVERVTGRTGHFGAAFRGAGSGAVVGSLFGFIFGLFDLIDPLVSALALAFLGLIFGIVIGAIIGLISHELSGEERDFSSVIGMEADRYDVMAEDEEVAEEASRMLAELRRTRKKPK